MIAAALAALLQACPASYDALVADGLRAARADRRVEAADVLGQAIAQCPGRPEAWVERGGLRFLEKRYADAVRDLERALRLHEDAYTRGLLASSLHLSGRGEEAVARWNALGQPALGSVEITGLTHTHEPVVRRELSFEPGRMLTVPQLRAGRRRLQEVGIFTRVVMRPLPKGDGTADVEVSISEKHGWAASRLDFLIGFGSALLQERIRLGYDNLAGVGIAIGAEHRFEDHRPQTSLDVRWPRPLGLPAHLRARGFWGRQDHRVDRTLRAERSRGAVLALRRVLGAQITGQMGLRLATVSNPAPSEGAWDGRLLGLEAGLDGSLLEARRHRVEGALRAAAAGGSGRAFGRGSAGVRYFVHLGEPSAEAGMPASVLAAQARAATVGRPAPLLDRFAVGASPEMELPLRGRLRAPGGIQDGRFLARSLLLLNLEWRRRILQTAGMEAGLVLFHDVARLEGTLVARDRWVQDVGVGFRMAASGAPVIRLDYGRGLTDGSRAFSFGLGQAF